MGGKACIRGMRVTVGMIVGRIGAGDAVDELLAEYSYLERENILQARRRARTGFGMKLLIDMNLLPRWGAASSVVQIRSGELSHTAIGTQVVNVLKQLESQLESGALVSITPHRARVRLLYPACEPSSNDECALHKAHCDRVVVAKCDR
jgi:hypothetical protein